MKNKDLLIHKLRGTVKRYSLVVSLLLAGLMSSGGAWAGKGFYENNAWNFQYAKNGGSSEWGSNTSGNPIATTTQNLGPVNSLRLKGYWVNTWATEGWTQSKVTCYYSTTKSNGNYVINKSESQGNPTWICDNGLDVDLFQWAPNNPGNNTLAISWNLDDWSEGNSPVSYINYVCPGFVGNSNIAFGEQSKSATKTYTFNSYGWATATASISGTDASAFSLSSSSITINSDNGSVDVTYTPTSTTEQTATLTLTGNVSGQEYTKTVSLSATGKNHSITPLIADTADVTEGVVTLSGYLKYAGCKTDIINYGFYYCEGADCTPSSSSSSIRSSEHTPISSGSSWSAQPEGLKDKTWYSYKSYAKSTADGVPVLSEETGHFYVTCDYPMGDTIYYTINAALSEDIPCTLEFKTFAAALTHLKSMSEYLASTSGNITNKLLKHIVFEVEAGEYGTADSQLDLSDINKITNYSVTKECPTHHFIVRHKGTARPTLNGLKLYESRYVTIDGFNIVRSTTTSHMSGATISMGRNNADNNAVPGNMKYANVSIINNTITAKGFCCVHVQGADTIYYENNELYADITATGDLANDRNWGASMKFMNCKNILILRNSFRGTHATNLFLQGSRNVLIMNNVFWNDNKYTENVAFIRPVYFLGNGENNALQNIGIYYNTFFLKDEGGSTDYKVNFIEFGGAAQKDNANYYHSNLIEFQYNNCYSYSDAVSGRTADPFLGKTISTDICPTFKNNNFWSKYDVAKSLPASAFAFGCSDKFINVENAVCWTASSDPASLVVKTNALNLGVSIGTDISGMGIADKLYNDRIYGSNLADAVRPKIEGGWTLGAYQQIGGNEVDVIVWNGTSDSPNDWDNRGNWVKMDGTKVTCVDKLSEKLKVIIPAPDSKVYPMPADNTIKTYPNMPTNFNVENRLLKQHAEQVDAGVGIIKTTKFFADSIYLEYGASLRGVERLVRTVGEQKDTLYNVATTNFTAQRSAFKGSREWILVGTVIKPFTGSGYETRNIKSGDFYIANQTPHVYMQHIQCTDGNVSWGTPFSSLQVEVPTTTAFAIEIPDQYGQYKLSSSLFYKYYYPDESMLNDGTQPKSFKFEGRFANDASLPTYSIVSGVNFLNNSYPANLDAYTLHTSKSGTVLMYDYELKSFRAPQSGEVIKPQNGFIFNATSTTPTPMTLGADLFVDGNTRYKRALDEKPNIYIRAINADRSLGSQIALVYDEFKEQTIDPNVDARKPFNKESSLSPELYIMAQDAAFASLNITNMETVIPLGLRNASKEVMDVKFVLRAQEGFGSAVLVDRQEGKEYDLLTGEAYTITNIAAGTIEGRFFLNLSGIEEPDPIDPENPPTDVEDTELVGESISIFAQNGSVIISSTEGVALQTVYVSDMAGKTDTYKLSGSHYQKLDLPVAKGVYLISVVGDTMTKEQKVIIK